MPPPLTRLLHYARHHAIAITALIVALGGTSYAAFTLPANSVGTQQLQNNSITPAKLKHRAIGGYVLAWAHVAANGRIRSGSPGAYATAPTPQAVGPVPSTVAWRGVKISRRCVPIVTPENTNPNVGEQANATLDNREQLLVWTYSGPGQYGHFPFYVAVIC
jgi:hypothetical protein